MPATLYTFNRHVNHDPLEFICEPADAGLYQGQDGLWRDSQMNTGELTAAPLDLSDPGEVRHLTETWSEDGEVLSKDLPRFTLFLRENGLTEREVSQVLTVLGLPS